MYIIQVVIMKRNNIAIIAVCCALVIAGTVFTGETRGETDENEGVISENYTDRPEPVMDKPSGLLAERTLDDLQKRTPLIVRGKINNKLEPIYIEAVFGGTPVPHTDYEVEIDEVFRGNCEDKIITVRIMGAHVENGYTYLAEPRFKEGMEYILFLIKPHMGAAYNVEGDDYYYIEGAEQGVYEKSEGESFVPQAQDERDVIILSEFALEMKSINEKYPVDEQRYSNDFYRNMKSNLESGFISQEEYDVFIAEADIYAKIVEK